MKVYVMTEANPFCPETYLGVKPSKKEAEKELRKRYPYMRKYRNDNYVSDASSVAKLLFIHEEEV